MYARIKKFYDQKLWTKEQVYVVTGLGVLTPEEYETITGEKYEAPAE